MASKSASDNPRSIFNVPSDKYIIFKRNTPLQNKSQLLYFITPARNKGISRKQISVKSGVLHIDGLNVVEEYVVFDDNVRVAFLNKPHIYVDFERTDIHYTDLRKLRYNRLSGYVKDLFPIEYKKILEDNGWASLLTEEDRTRAVYNSFIWKGSIFGDTVISIEGSNFFGRSIQEFQDDEE